MKAVVFPSTEYIKSRFVEDGEVVPSALELVIPVTELSREARQKLVTWCPGREELRFRLPPDSGVGRYPAPFIPETPREWEEFIAQYDAALTQWHVERERQARDELAKDRAKLAQGHFSFHYNSYYFLPEFPEWQREYDAALDAARQAREAFMREQRDREEQAREERARERAAWIAKYGSDGLKRRVAAGYDCQRRYALERAALEYPEYELDFNGTADWKPRSCPSDAALDEAERVGGEVVWLTAAPSSDLATDDEEGDEADYERYALPQEAVVKRHFLGLYYLVRTI